MKRNKMERNVNDPEVCPRFQDPQGTLADTDNYSMKNSTTTKSFMVPMSSVYVRPSSPKVFLHDLSIR